MDPWQVLSQTVPAIVDAKQGCDSDEENELDEDVSIDDDPQMKKRKLSEDERMQRRYD